MSTQDSVLRAALTAVLSLSFLVPAARVIAQAPVVHINGQVWDGNGGPFAAGIVYHIISNGAGCCLSVPTGRTLTMQAGAIVKIDVAIGVQGALIARGVTFTSWHDDTVGGDSNNNGSATLPGRGDWWNIELNGSALLEDCTVRYGGGTYMAVHHRNGTMTMRRCVIEHSGADGLDLSQRDSTVTDTTIRLCSGVAIENVRLEYIQSLLDNTAAQCDGGDYVRITHGMLTPGSGAVVLDRRHSLNQSGIFVANGTTNALDVRTGTSLTVPRGTILKIERGRVWSQSNLQLQGTPAEPVTITSLADDSVGGDTNKDGGATQPAPGDWTGLQLVNGADASVVQNAVVRFGGSSGTEGAGIAIHGNGAIVRDTVVEKCRGAGVYFRAAFPGSYPAVTGCALLDNETVAGLNIPWQALALCRDNQASGNAGGDHFVVAPERPPVPVTVGPTNYPGDVLVVATDTLLTAGGELTLLQGTQIKFHDGPNGLTASLNGALRLLGTADEPIVLTSIHDDSVGGDTNRNGNATVPQPGKWRDVWIGDTRVVSDSVLENVIVRYAGNGSRSGVTARNPRLTLRSIRVEHVLARGMELSIVRGDVVNPVVWDAGQTGIVINGGSFDILHATITGCGGFGIEEINSAFSGAVRNSIVRNNAGGNFGGTLTVGEVHFTNGGFAGSNGNIDQPSQFVNATAGDLNLALGSPCLGTADLATGIAVAKDHDEASRVLDHALTGSARPDMGAYERAVFRMTTTGEPLIGTTMTFTVQGPTGFSTAFLGFLDGAFFLSPLGMELAGLSIYFLAPSGVPVGQSMAFPLPNNATLRGLSFGVQGVGLSLSSPGFGNFTNLHRATLR